MLDDLELLVVFSNDTFLLLCLLLWFHSFMSSNIFLLSSFKVFVSEDRFPISDSNLSNLLLLRSWKFAIVSSRRIISVLIFSTSSFSFLTLLGSIVSFSAAQLRSMCFCKIFHLNGWVLNYFHLSLILPNTVIETK